MTYHTAPRLVRRIVECIPTAEPPHRRTDGNSAVESGDRFSRRLNSSSVLLSCIYHDPPCGEVSWRGVADKCGGSRRRGVSAKATRQPMEVMDTTVPVTRAPETVRTRQVAPNGAKTPGSFPLWLPQGRRESAHAKRSGSHRGMVPIFSWNEFETVLPRISRIESAGEKFDALIDLLRPRIRRYALSPCRTAPAGSIRCRPAAHAHRASSIRTAAAAALTQTSDDGGASPSPPEGKTSRSGGARLTPEASRKIATLREYR